MSWKIGSLLLSAFALCAGMDCQGTTPAAMPVPLQIADGAYAGVLLAKSDVRPPDEEPSPVTGTRHKIVEIVAGRIVNVRTAPDRNGPFDCWRIEPGSKRIVGTIVFGGDGNLEQTVVETGEASFRFATSITFDGMVFTGEGSVELSSAANGTIGYEEISTFNGAGQIGEDNATGTLSRIGDVGTVPMPSGMNGSWSMVNSQDGITLAIIGIQALRVVQFFDGNGTGNVLSSQPVSGADAVGSFVFVSFSVEQGGVGGQLVTVTFQGSVEALGRIVGHATAEFPGQPSGEYDVVLERVASSDCQSAT